MRKLTRLFEDTSVLHRTDHDVATPPEFCPFCTGFPPRFPYRESLVSLTDADNLTTWLDNLTTWLEHSLPQSFFSLLKKKYEKRMTASVLK